MSDRFFLDTNILVYLFDEAAAKAEPARRLVDQALGSGNGAISYQVVQEFFNVAFLRFPRPMQAEPAQQFYSSVLRPLCIVHSSTGLFHKALQLYDRYHLQWYDSLIVAGAVEAKCGILYSEDFQRGQRFDDLEVRNPFL